MTVDTKPLIGFGNEPGWVPSKFFNISKRAAVCGACNEVLPLGAGACFRRWNRKGQGQLVHIACVHRGPDGPVPAPSTKEEVQR